MTLTFSNVMSQISFRFYILNNSDTGPFPYEITLLNNEQINLSCTSFLNN